jgi:two-component system NtrC family sensor kinase
MRVKLALGSIALVVFAISFTAGFILRLATKELRANLTMRNVEIARRAAEEIASYVEGARRDLSESADLLQFLDRMPWASTVLLENKVMMSAIFDTVVVVDRNGVIRADNHLGRVRLSDFSPDAVRMAIQGVPWTSPVEIDSRGLPGMSLVLVPGRDFSLLARLSLERIWRLIDDIDAGPGGFAYLVSSDGTLIAYPDKTAVLRREKPAPPGAPSSRNMLLVSSPVPGLGWSLYIQQPLEKAFFSVSLVLRRSILLVLGGLLMAAILSAIIARLYSRSMDALLWGTVRIAEGDLDYQIPSHSPDEFGVLSQAFNGMVLRLRERTAALEDSERRYRHVTEGVRDIIFTLDGSGRFLFVNSQAERVLGYPKRQLIGTGIRELLASPADPAGGPFPAGLFDDRNTGSREVRVRTLGGQEVILELESVRSGAPGAGGEIHGIARDITQRKLMEEKLHRSEKLAALGEIVAKVAHELRNAVAGITASMEMARERGRAEAGLAGDLDRVLAEAARAQGIVQGLLGSSTARSVSPQPCSLNDAITSVLDLRKGSREAAGIELFLGLSQDIPPVLVDPGQLQQVFQNLVANAEQALSSGNGEPAAARRLSVRTWADAGQVLAEVSDSGTGIPLEHLGRVFDPFFTTRSATGGSGLGLAVSLGIVEAYGGDIEVRSTPGEGAVFTVRFPAQSPDAFIAPLPAQADLGGGQILVVEDEASIREFLQHFLKSLGFSVDSAANGREAVAQLSSGISYSLVISDYRMPDRDGRELYEWIRASRPGLLRRLIYITGDSLNPITLAFLEETGVPFLLKPVVASALIEQVRRTLKTATGSAD